MFKLMMMMNVLVVVTRLSHLYMIITHWLWELLAQLHICNNDNDDGGSGSDLSFSWVHKYEYYCLWDLSDLLSMQWW